MDRKHIALAILLFLPVHASAAATYTPLLNLCKPGENDYDWLDCVNNNFDILDSSNVQTNASGLTTGQLPNARLDPSSVTLFGPWIPAEKVNSGILPLGTSVQSYVDGSIGGQDIRQSTIPLSKLSGIGCSANQVARYNGSAWTCGDELTGDAIPQWTRYEVTFATFGAAATSSSTLILQAPAKTVVHQIVVKHSVSFSGGSISNYDLSVGTGTANPFNTYYTSGFNVNSSVAADNAQFTFGSVSDSYTASWAIYVTAKTLGDNLNQANQGRADIWFLTSLLP